MIKELYEFTKTLDFLYLDVIIILIVQAKDYIMENFKDLNKEAKVEKKGKPRDKNNDQKKPQNDKRTIEEEIKELNLELEGKGGKVSFSKKILKSPLKSNSGLFKQIKKCCKELRQ